MLQTVQRKTVHDVGHKAQNRPCTDCLPNTTPYGLAALAQHGRREERWGVMNNTCCILNSAIILKLFVFPITNGNKQHNIVGLILFHTKEHEGLGTVRVLARLALSECH